MIIILLILTSDRSRFRQVVSDAVPERRNDNNSNQEEIEMLRHIFKATEQHYNFDLPLEFIGHDVELLVFCLDEANTKPAPVESKLGILDFAGVLKDSPNFNGDIVQLQREIRDEWH